jgi:Subtilase family
MKHVLSFITFLLMFFTQPLFADSLDIVVIWHRDSPVSYYLNQLNARQIEMSLPSNARLIRLPLPPSGGKITVNIYGRNYAYLDAEGVLEQVGVIKNGTEGVSDENYDIYVPENDAPEDDNARSPLPLHTLSCGRNANLLISQNNGLSSTIAILDTGTDTLNLNISKRLDKLNSYNCIDNDANIQSPAGTHHGPFVASIASRFMANADKLLIFKVLNNNGKGVLFDAIKGIDKAILAGANGIVMSFVAKRSVVSTATMLTPLGAVIETAKGFNILTFSAAGNDDMNIGTKYYVPASEPFANNVVVGSSNCNNAKSGFSNYSNAVSNSEVWLSTIGENVIGYGSNASTILKWQGTSFSNPMIAGVVIQLWHHFAATTTNYADIANALLQNTVYESSWDGSLSSNTGCSSKGNVHAQNTYNALKGTILPIIDLKLKAETNNEIVKLDWQPLYGKKIKHILVEKSNNAVNFAVAGMVLGNETAFTDNEPLKGVSYYRLVLFDEKNQTDTSKITAITVKQDLDMRVFPNPVQQNDRLIVHYTLESFLEKGLISITDMYQKTHFVYPLRDQPADTYELDFFKAHQLSLPAGMYECMLQIGTQTERRKFVILR